MHTRYDPAPGYLDALKGVSLYMGWKGEVCSVDMDYNSVGMRRGIYLSQNVSQSIKRTMDLRVYRM